MSRDSKASIDPLPDVFEPVSLELEDDIAFIIINSPPVNALSHLVRKGVLRDYHEALRNPSVRAIVLLCAGNTFIAGADIKEFGQIPLDPSLHEMLAALEMSTKLTVAAIHGSALGGGLETAMCCHYRIATASAKLGLPESKLGLLPGAGGTQRLPRLIGIEKAADMMITGIPVDADAAMDSGLVNALASQKPLREEALAFVRQLLADKAPLCRVSDLPISTVSTDVFATLRRQIKKRFRGQQAPEKIVRCLEIVNQGSFDDGLRFERSLFEESLLSRQSTAMRHIFFAERNAAKVPGVRSDTAIRPIGRVAIVGAGTMGAGIALACLGAGLSVTLLDVSADGLDRGVRHVEKVLASQQEKGRLTRQDRQDQLDRLRSSTDYASLASVDLVIEAVYESMKLKEEVFTEFDKVCKPDAILATNTSTLDVDRIAAVTNRPGDVIGLHFFSPANVMRLLEIVRGDETSQEVIASVLAFANQIGKLGVVVGNCFGFVGNRMLYGYGRESQLLLLEGAAPEQIDSALYEWGMAMGPNAMGDLAGLDIGYNVRKERTDLPNDPRYYRIATVLAEQGRFGQKTGKGMYLYHADDRRPYPDPEVHAIIGAEAQRLGIKRREIADDEIVQRCILALVVEGTRLLEEGIVNRSGDIDAIWVNGYGFPRWRGGPMCYADAVGLETINEQLGTFRETMGEQYWRPPALLTQLAVAGRSFGEYDSSIGVR